MRPVFRALLAHSVLGKLSDCLIHNNIIVLASCSGLKQYGLEKALTVKICLTGGGSPTQVKHRKSSIEWHLPQIPINMAKNTVPSLSNRWDCWKREYGKEDVPQRSRRHTGHEQGDILLTQQDAIYCRYLSKLLISHTFVVEFKHVMYIFGLLLFLKWCPVNIVSVMFYPGWETRRVELPERTLLITKRTHHNTASNFGVTYFFAKRRKNSISWKWAVWKGHQFTGISKSVYKALIRVNILYNVVNISYDQKYVDTSF